MRLSRLEYLFNRYISQQCSLQEEKELMLLLDEIENDAAIQLLIAKVIDEKGPEVLMPDHVAAPILQRILQRVHTVVAPFVSKKIVFVKWMRAVAAVVLLVVGTVFWIFVKETRPQHRKCMLAVKAAKILPGGNHALLTLADGATIVLDTIENGKILHGYANVNKQNGLLIFNSVTTDHIGSSITYNTLSTPRGGKYQIILPDSSKVWLNAASSLQFPTAFRNKSREVKLKGEAYFEIKKDRNRPFKVIVGEMEVKVLGTHFNIQAYDDEGTVATSLLEGSVKIIKGKETDFLKPGQQGILDKKEGKMAIREVDMDRVMAWKNELFQFDGDDITAIMRKISRWYNVEIVYEGNVSSRQFAGKISRNARLSEVLRILRLSNVKFSLVGNKIIVQ